MRFPTQSYLVRGKTHYVFQAPWRGREFSFVVARWARSYETPEWRYSLTPTTADDFLWSNDAVGIAVRKLDIPLNMISRLQAVAPTASRLTCHKWLEAVRLYAGGLAAGKHEVPAMAMTSEPSIKFLLREVESSSQKISFLWGPLSFTLMRFRSAADDDLQAPHMRYFDLVSEAHPPCSIYFEPDTAGPGWSLHPDNLENFPEDEECTARELAAIWNQDPLQTELLVAELLASIEAMDPEFFLNRFGPLTNGSSA